MKKRFLFLFFVLAYGASYAQGFIVKDFSADIHISGKGYFDVEENYEIEFTESKHGFIRDIFTNYEFEDEEGNVSKQEIYISKIKVPKHKYSIPSKWDIQLGSDKKVEIKIGSKNKLVRGKQNYTIKYRVKNAFIETDSLVQFYWNVKPSDWQANFEKVQFRIHAPKKAELSAGNSFVYAGLAGDDEPSDQFEYSYDGNVFTGVSKPDFNSKYGESVTVLVKMPKDLIPKASYSPPLWKKYAWVVFLPIILIFYVRSWLKHGRSKRVVTTTSYYPPKGMDPPMADYLLKNKGSNSGLIALIPEWGAKGIIRVEESDTGEFDYFKEKVKDNMDPEKKAPDWAGKAFGFVKKAFQKKDVLLIRKQELPEDAPLHQKRIYRGLFGNSRNSVRVSSLKNHFYKTMESAKRDLGRETKIYYDQKAAKINLWTGIAAVAATIGLPVLFIYFWGFVAGVAAFGCGVLMIALSANAKKRNNKGNEAVSELRGFKKFIKVAEINRIKMLIDEDPDYFEKTMGYAVAFGMLDKWAKKFDSLNIEPPEWYSGPTRAAGMSGFARSFTSTMAATSTAVKAPKSSSSGGSSGSGGGSAGGGFGGGGGRSW